ncbi:MAG: glycosyltransferase, partial [Tabrizicola sp.]
MGQSLTADQSGKTDCAARRSLRMDNRNVATFVLMRFNVEFPGYEHLDTNSREWLDYRLRLAELTAFHSLKLQSLKNFKLVLLVSNATPESFLDALSHATQGLDVIFLQADSAS